MTRWLRVKCFRTRSVFAVHFAFFAGGDGRNDGREDQIKGAEEAEETRARRQSRRRRNRKEANETFPICTDTDRSRRKRTRRRIIRIQEGRANDWTRNLEG